jgi:tRNA (guanine-N7-)-methyltransferase
VYLAVCEQKDAELAGPSRNKPLMQPGEIEHEFGVAFPGAILPEDQWTRTAIKRLPAPGPLDWTTVFGREAPVVLELGCGNGRFTLQSALARPELNHFAIDVLPVVIRYATRRANQRGLHNVRFAVKDAQTFMAAYVGESSVAEAHLYHPQPFHDPRQSHRRVLTPAFLAEVHRALVPSGLFVVQTDNPDYWHYMTRVIPHFFELRDQDGPWPDAPEGRSRREIIARQRGLRIFRGIGRRLDDLDRSSALEVAASLPPPRFRSHGPWCELDRWEDSQGGG